MADFTHLPTHCKFIAFMPQWDFLDFLAAQGEAVSDVSPLDARRGRGPDRGVGAGRRRRGRRRRRASTRSAPIWSSAPTAVIRPSANGPASRYRSSVRRWMCCGSALAALRTTRRASMGRFDSGRIFVLINRDRYWQCGYVIPKGTLESSSRPRHRGVPRDRRSDRALRAGSGRRAPQLGRREALDRACRSSLALVSAGTSLHWRCRARHVSGRGRRHQPGPPGRRRHRQPARGAAGGRAAHAWPIWRKVQKRREWPTRVTQWFQVQAQQRIIANVLGRSTSLRLPLALRLLARYAILRRIPARLIGIGVRPEHVRSPEMRRLTARLQRPRQSRRCHSTISTNRIPPARQASGQVRRNMTRRRAGDPGTHSAPSIG